MHARRRRGRASNTFSKGPNTIGGGQALDAEVQGKYLAVKSKDGKVEALRILMLVACAL